MPATRLLVIADSKMLPALANGLRESAKFDVLTVPLSDRAGAQAAAEKADAVALFYGAPGAPLTAALQALSPKVRERGGRVVAVLQREQAAQRDDCFRAGASDLLFMPMPKDQFVARLVNSVELAWGSEGGAAAPVAVATRTAASKVDKATISDAGVETPSELPLKSGDTVRLSFATFQSWGLVVRPGPTAQIRFAGLAPDEEVQVRDWVKGGGQPKPRPTPAAGVAPVSKPAPPPGPVLTPPPPSAAPSMAAAAPTPLMAPDAGPLTTPGGSIRAAPAAGPPPGFADRKPIRPRTGPHPRIPPPVMSSGAPPAPASAETPPITTPVSVAPAAPSAPPPNGALASLFEEGAPHGVAAPEAAAPPAEGPPWPTPAPAEACKAAATQLLKDKTVPNDVPPGIAASAKKITGNLSSSERAALEKAGPDSHLADALAARIALDAATSDGVRLYSSTPAATVDAVAVAALTRQTDDAATRLQKEANAAVGKGEVETLQMITAASAALSRDLLNFKETADRLRGLGAAPRLGAGALDPDVVLPGQAPRPKPLPTLPATQPVKAELRDFQGLDRKGGAGKTWLAVLLIAAAIVVGAQGFYFGFPHSSEMSVEGAGAGVVRIEVSDDSALVTVTSDWIANAEVRAMPLASVLREHGVKKAILVLPNGSTSGALDVTTGKLVGVPKKPAPK